MEPHGSDSALPYGLAPTGHRLPAATRVGRVRLQVADLVRSVEWYRGVTGFALLERTDGRAALGARHDGVPLIELHERPGAASVAQRPRLGLYHFAVLLPDRASLGRLVAHLREIGEPAGASDHLVSEALYLTDPDGLGVEVYADRPRSSWQHRSRELAMATEPLDLASLLRAAGDEAWDGMPPDTIIGHVHLHVGDLDQAAAFYHDGVGLDKVVWSYPGALFLSAGGYHHHLGVNTWARAAPPAGPDDARLLDWELLVPSSNDARHVIQNLAAAGYDAQPAADGGLARDPWGTALRVSSVALP